MDTVLSETAPTAMVTGGSRGVGRGVVIGLAEAGFNVYATGRSITAADLPAGVRRIPCDHAFDDQTRAAFAQVRSDCRSLDLLVNNAWGGYERMVEDGVFTWPAPFWEQPLHRWDAMMNIGVRSAFVCSAEAAALMIPQRRGLIVNVGFWAARRHLGNAIYGISKAAVDKLTADSAFELAQFGVHVISLYPGLVRTELVLQAAADGAFDLRESESPEFIGRVVAALHSDDSVASLSGGVVVAAEAARRLDVVDVDGRQPVVLTADDV